MVHVMVLQQHIPDKGIPSFPDRVPVPEALKEWKYMVLHEKWGHVYTDGGGTLPWRTVGGKGRTAGFVHLLPA